MGRAQQILSRIYESAASVLIDNLVRIMQDVGRQWKIKYPDEGIDDEYMRVNFDRDFPDMGFVLYAGKKGNVIKGSKPAPKDLGASRLRKGCFYNSVDFMHRFEKRFPKVELAYGVMVEPSMFSDAEVEVKKAGSLSRTLSRTTIHAFLVDGNKVIDPTLGRMPDVYYYDTVPSSVWKKFNYKPNDSNYDAKDFADFVYKSIEAKQKAVGFKKRLNSIGGI